jgi:hypothetical protein
MSLLGLFFLELAVACIFAVVVLFLWFLWSPAPISRNSKSIVRIPDSQSTDDEEEKHEIVETSLTRSSESIPLEARAPSSPPAGSGREEIAQNEVPNIHSEEVQNYVSTPELDAKKRNVEVEPQDGKKVEKSQHSDSKNRELAFSEEDSEDSEDLEF